MQNRAVSNLQLLKAGYMAVQLSLKGFTVEFSAPYSIPGQDAGVLATIRHSDSMGKGFLGIEADKPDMIALFGGESEFMTTLIKVWEEIPPLFAPEEDE